MHSSQWTEVSTQADRGEEGEGRRAGCGVWLPAVNTSSFLLYVIDGSQTSLLTIDVHLSDFVGLEFHKERKLEVYSN